MTTPTIPSALTLDDAGRLYMLTWLEVDVLLGRIPDDVWRAAYGRAADYQTVVNARAVTLVNPVQKTTEWGAPVGEAKPLAQLIIEQAQDALRKPELRDGYSRGAQPTMVQRIIASEIEKAFKVELQGHVKEAQQAAVAAVKASAAEVIGETIDRARRGLA